MQPVLGSGARKARQPAVHGPERIAELLRRAHDCTTKLQRLDDRITALRSLRKELAGDVRQVQAQINRHLGSALNEAADAPPPAHPTTPKADAPPSAGVQAQRPRESTSPPSPFCSRPLHAVCALPWLAGPAPMTGVTYR